MKPTTLGFIGKRLREAREARGMTAVALSDPIGISRQAISQYENGIQSPRPEVTEKMATILNVPLSYFRYPNENQIGTIFYRSMSAATKSARLRAENRYIWLRTIVAYLRKFIEFPKDNFQNFKTPSDPNLIPDEQIEDLAAQTRTVWNLSNVPIGNMVSLLESNGVIITRDDLKAVTLDAFSDISQATDCPQYIVLGTEKSTAVRSRFDAAHELGHRILHQNIDKIYLTRKAEYSLIEKQAHRFAAAFLLPADAFAEDFYSSNLDALKNLKPKWKVAVAMMLKRAEDLNFISADQARYLWINLSRRGWKTKEPLDDELEIEQPQLLRRAFEMVVNEKIKTKQEIVSQIPLSSTDIENLAALRQGYLTESYEEIATPISIKDYQNNVGNASKTRNNNYGEIIRFPSKAEKN